VMTVRVGVIGCGYWGPNLVRNFARTEGTSLSKICDSRFERAAKVAAQYGVRSVTEDAKAVIDSPDVDLVVIATPSLTHYELAREALAAGKHVLVMKPLATSVAHAEELVALAERKGVLLAVDHTFVYTGAVRKIKELVDAGQVGSIYYIDSVRINLGLFQSDVNVVWDLAPHDISIIDYLLDGREPESVSTIGARHVDSPTENIAYLSLRYGDQLLAHVHVNWLAPAKVRRMIVGGSKKMIIYDDVEPSEKILVYDKGVKISKNGDPGENPYQLLVEYRTGDMHAPRLDTREALALEAEQVVQCIRKGGRPVADGQAGLRVVRVLEAAEQSLARGEPVLLGQGGQGKGAIP